MVRVDQHRRTAETEPARTPATAARVRGVSKARGRATTTVNARTMARRSRPRPERPRPAATPPCQGRFLRQADPQAPPRRTLDPLGARMNRTRPLAVCEPELPLPGLVNAPAPASACGSRPPASAAPRFDPLRARTPRNHAAWPLNHTVDAGLRCRQGTDHPRRQGPPCSCPLETPTEGTLNDFRLGHLPPLAKPTTFGLLFGYM